MFFRLWKTECMQIAKSLTYWLYVIVLVLFFTSQLGNLGNSMAKEPKKGQESYMEYGYKTSQDETEIMRAALGELVSGYYYEHFTTYPVGFAKNVTLSESEKQEIAEIIKETTGLSSEEEIGNDMERHYEMYPPETNYVPYKAEPKEGLTYETFLTYMKRVEEMLGPGSGFSEDAMKSAVKLPLDYEGAKEVYDNLVKKDGFTGGYARLFCDYMGIIAAILPVFVTATRVLRDKRAQMQDLVFTREVSSVTLVGSRYVAMLSMMMLPIVLLSVMPMIDCIVFTKGSGIALDYFAFLKYDFGWLFPTVMVVTALAYVVTEWTESALAVLIQGIWWFVSLFLTMYSMQGGAYGWNLMPRHNTELNYEGFANGFTQLLCNRILYAVLAVVLVIVTIGIYEKKRKGHLRRDGKILRNRKRTSKA